MYLRSYGRVWRASAHRGLVGMGVVGMGFPRFRYAARSGLARAGMTGCGEWALGPVPRPGLVSTSSVCLTRKVTSPARASPRSRDARGRDPSSEADVRSVPRGRNHDPCGGASERSRHVTFGPVSALRGYALAIPACVRARVATRRVRPRPRIRRTASGTSRMSDRHRAGGADARGDTRNTGRINFLLSYTRCCRN